MKNSVFFALLGVASAEQIAHLEDEPEFLFSKLDNSLTNLLEAQ